LQGFDERTIGREETLRAIFCGLSCDLLRSERWQAFTSVPLST
jgi:hypothetical protein